MKTTLFLLFLVSGIISFAQVSSDFNISADGWSTIVASAGQSYAPTYNSTGGNPGGNLSVDLINPTTPYYSFADRYFDAPAKFLGNKSYSYNKNLTFDLQQSLAGADVTFGDVVISSAASGAIYFRLASPPANGSWSSYSVLLNETSGWHYGSITGAAPTKSQMKQILVNISSLRIRAQFYGNFPAGNYSVKLDNVVLNTQTLGTLPGITSFTPTSGIPNSTSVTITGSNFNATASNNIVYFGGVKASVTSATGTQLIVQVPKGAQNAPIIVVNSATGLGASTIKNFTPLFDNNKDFGGQIIRASLSGNVAFDVQVNGTKGNTVAADIDGDGLNDLIVGEGAGGFSGSKQFSVFRNAGLTGSISTGSFLPKVSFTTIQPYTKGFVAVADFDGDGKQDVVLSTADNSNAHISIFRNISTPGTISFEAAVDYAGYSYSDGPLTAADMDGDGRPEILAVFNNNCATGDRLYIYTNLSTPGNIDFTAFSTFGNVYTCGGNITVGDLDGDKFNDVVVTAGSNSVTVFKNTSSPGALSLGTPFQLSTTSSGNVIIADLDRDGLQDIAWPYYAAQNIIVKKNIYAGGTFDASSFGADIFLTSPFSYIQDELASGDVNGDGKIDLVLAGSSDMAIFENASTVGTLDANSFLYGIPFSTGGGSPYPLSPILADFDGDNKQDISLRLSNVGNVGALLVYHNESYPAPRIDSFSPSNGSAGDGIVLTGDFMNTGNALPSARLAGIKTSSSTSINNTATSVIVPLGSKSGRISLTEHGLTAFSKPFPYLFGTNRTIDATSFSSSIDFALTINTRDAIEIADFDDDGKMDVVAVDNFSTTKIFKNTQPTNGQPITTSSLTLESTTYTASYNIVALDIDGDGKVDLNNGYGLLENNGSGTISFIGGPNGAYTYAGGFNYVAKGDFNKDGKTDLAVTNGTAFIQVYENQSTTEPFVNNNYLSTYKTNPVNFAKPNTYGGIVAADFDNDGYDDLVSTSSIAGTFTVYGNKKVYGPITTSSFLHFGDNATSGSQPYSLTADDFDGDGKTDIAITYFNSTFISIYRNISSPGDISFATPVDITCLSKGYNIASQDLDGDGLAEIVVIHQPNPGPGSFTVFKNNSTMGTLNFSAAVNFSITRNPQALSIADINQDQKPDILIVASSGVVGNALMVFENKIASGPVITITTQPSDFIACAGDVATFTAAGTGTTNIVYQWQFSLTGAVGTFSDIANGGGYTNANTATLSVNTTGNFGAGRYRCKISGDLATTVFTNDEGLFINPIPTAPTTTPDADCVPAALTLTASGGTNGQYRWYTVPTGGTAITGQTNSIYITPVISTTTTYYVSINNGSCESTRSSVLASINPITKPILTPSTPAVSGTVNICSGDVLTITAPSGFTTYTWSNGASTNPITITTTTSLLTVQVSDGAGCVSPLSDALNIVVNPYPVATITVNGTQLTASPGDSYQWYQNGSTVSGATSQFFDFNFLEYGLYQVDVTDNGCTATSADFEYLITGAENITQELKVYPNPIDENLSIEFQPPYTLAVIDITGKTVQEMTVKTKSTVINLSSLSKGMYLLQIRSDHAKHNMRISKK